MTTLYRAFHSRDHADAFLAGHIRLGHLGYYRALESAARGDRTEGQGHHLEYRADRTAVRISGRTAHEVLSPGVVSVRSECGNDVFICCLTRPPDEPTWDRIRKDFGDVVVEISDADRLLADIRSARDAGNPWQRGAPIMLWEADYTKGLERHSVEHTDAVRLAVTQKPPEYSYQHEHRIALISYGTWDADGRPPEFMTVRVPHTLDYARIVSVRLEKT